MISKLALIAHAVRLVGSTSEVDCRRAVSASYYGLFHQLASAGADLFKDAGPAVAAQVARAFEHRTMYQACRSVLDKQRGSANLKLRQIAEAFIDLQDARHRADYDITGEFTRVEAVRLVTDAVAAQQAWEAVAAEQDAKEFLAQLLLGSRLNRRG